MAAIKAEPGIEVVGSDFSMQMLLNGDRKRRDKTGSSRGPRLIQADTLNLPFRDNTFDGAMVGFGMRNVSDLPAGLKELNRVLKPGGIRDQHTRACTKFECVRYSFIMRSECSNGQYQ